MKPNRWLLGAVPAIAMHLSIGSVYAWSALTKPLLSQFNGVDYAAKLDEGLSIPVPESTLKWAFSIAIFCLGMSAAFLGKFVQDFGPRISGRISGVCFGLGTIGAGFAIAQQNVLLLFLMYGVLGGIGLGTGYITPVKTLIKWFYDRKGLATGMAVMGFGFGSVIAGPVYNALFTTFADKDASGEITAYHNEYAFYIMGAIYMVLIVGASFLIQVPPKGWGEEIDSSGAVIEKQRQYTTGQALRTWQFYALWVMLFINITCGIAIVYTASPMAQDELGMSSSTASILAVSIVALFNGLGRFVWATLSDKLGRPAMFVLYFCIQVVAFSALGLLIAGGNVPEAIFLGLVYIIASCYGGGFGTIPAYLSDLFGNASVSAIHGCVLTAWALAGIAGPEILVRVKGAHEPYNYQGAMFFFAGLMIVALAVGAFLMFSLKRSGNGFDPLAPASLAPDGESLVPAGSVPQETAEEVDEEVIPGD